MLRMGAAEPKQGCALVRFKDADFKFGVHVFSRAPTPSLPPSLPATCARNVCELIKGPRNKPR